MSSIRKYYKITNEKELHRGFQYQTGLNILNEPFNNKSDEWCVSGGLYFTRLENINKYYHYGVWIREIILPTDNKKFKMVQNGDKYRSNMIILGEKYSLANIETYHQLSLEYPEPDIASMNGCVEILDWWKSSDQFSSFYKYYKWSAALLSGNYREASNNWKKYSNYKLKYTEKAMDYASERNHIFVLDWWFRSGLPLLYSDDAMDWASGNGYVDVLEWWKKSSLDLKYTKYAIDWASKNGHIEVLEWWLKSGLKLEYSSKAVDDASANGEILILDWWIKSGLNFKYSIDALDLASKNGKINILDWWHEAIHCSNKYLFCIFCRSGKCEGNCEKSIRYAEEIIHWATRNSKLDVLRWWQAFGEKNWETKS